MAAAVEAQLACQMSAYGSGWSGHGGTVNLDFMSANRVAAAH